MLNANVILSMVKGYTKRNNEISEDKFLDLVSVCIQNDVDKYRTQD